MTTNGNTTICRYSEDKKYGLQSSLMLTSQVVEEAEVVVMCAVLMDTWKRQAAAVDSLTPAEI